MSKEIKIRTAAQIYAETEASDEAIWDDMAANPELWKKMTFEQSMERMIMLRDRYLNR